MNNTAESLQKRINFDKHNGITMAISKLMALDLSETLDRILNH